MSTSGKKDSEPESPGKGKASLAVDESIAIAPTDNQSEVVLNGEADYYDEHHPGNTGRKLIAPFHVFNKKWAKLSLRTRLLLGLILLTTIGLSVADIVVYSQTESFLIHQVNEELFSAIHPVERYFESGISDLSSAPTGTYGEVLNSKGIVINAFPATDGPGPVIPPSVVQEVISSAQKINRNSNPVIFSAPATTSKSSITAYQVMVIPAFNGYTDQIIGVEVIAIPLNSFNDTLHHLKLFDLAVGLGVLFVLALFTYILVRIGMKPLEEIENTADAIAKGDLSQRVSVAEPTTELGRLGMSLNTMLSQIEYAFNKQQSSENKLRQFLADASHELRTPLTSIRGYAELFRLGANQRPEDLERSMARIESEAQRMAALVEDLLLLARLDQGHIYQYGDVDLTQIAADVAMDAHVMAPEREITFDSDEQVTVCGDEPALRQVAANLVRNALVHTPNTAAIHIAARKSAESGIFEVIDEGQGIPKEHLDKVFERFYKVDSSRNRDKGGVGLGLSIVASIVEAHKGSIKVDSVIGLGTHFWVEIPISRNGNLESESIE